MPNRKWVDENGDEWFEVDIPRTGLYNHTRLLLELGHTGCFHIDDSGYNHNICLKYGSDTTIVHASRWIMDRFGIPVVTRDEAKQYKSARPYEDPNVILRGMAPDPRFREMVDFYARVQMDRLRAEIRSDLDRELGDL